MVIRGNPCTCSAKTKEAHNATAYVNKMHSLWITCCGSFATALAMSPSRRGRMLVRASAAEGESDPPTRAAMEGGRSAGFVQPRQTRKGVTAAGRRTRLPDFACLEGVPSPAQVGRDRDSHGSLLALFSSALLSSLPLFGELAVSLAN